MRYQYYISTEEFYNPLIYRYDWVAKELAYWYNGEWNSSLGCTSGKEITEEEAIAYLAMEELVS